MWAVAELVSVKMVGARACQLVDAKVGDLDNIPTGSKYRPGSNPGCPHQKQKER